MREAEGTRWSGRRELLRLFAQSLAVAVTVAVLAFFAHARFDRDRLTQLANAAADPVTTGTIPPRRPKF